MDYGYLTLQATFDKDLHLFHSFQLNILARERKSVKQGLLNLGAALHPVQTLTR